MAGNIFLLQSGDTLVKMQEASYESEALLQELLANYPDLLAGEQIDPDQPREWLLVSRELPIPDTEESLGRWPIDHLFLDQDAIPTLVEVKRSTDSRIRREVVGQMLDYAANAVVYLALEAIQAKFERTCETSGHDPEVVLAEFLKDKFTPESFWQSVKTNLQAGRVRLVFVADVIPPELKRIVEFLNGQMDPAEVLAIEIKQYLGEGNLKTLVPRLIGQTALAQQKKEVAGSNTGKSEKIDERFYFEEMVRTRGEEEAKVAKRIRDWAASEQLKLVFVQRPKSVSFMPELHLPNKLQFQIVSAQSYGEANVGMRWLCKYPPFKDEARRAELQAKFQTVSGVLAENMVGFVHVKLDSLRDPKILEAYLATLSWMVKQLREA